ncbi:uncharacterized protein EAF01_006402 [Botrytis porri]|uniref:Gamma interferon inducible lysosomal thiol reductase GILT n=1 Tax=Botrytis porri TaxID=87229 RepID=A0A4Z1KV96_9HELO|nr:uncharacterized protein EAF01_006402 [Botrytis porri]KAF7903353.1 hypothetical protein EAF01_006402 [Botrytis porri]TGO88353.1 hypothetical protein BPOR_0167g00050 [Botrytis porri]
MKDSLPTINTNFEYHSMGNEKTERMLTGPPARRARPLAFGALTVALLYLLWTANIHQLFMGCGMQPQPVGANHAKDVVSVSDHKPIPLEAHIMSKCPDAQDCLKMMVLPAMQRVYDKVNFTLSFIGAPTDNDGVACKHGPQECMGNILELCSATLYPDPKIYLGFTMCLTRDYKDIPDRSLVEDCALEHGMDFEKLNACTVQDDGGYGMGMLRDSVRRSTEAGVVKSCTVRLNEEIFCVRDGRKWTDCPGGSEVNDLILAVEKLYHQS